MPTSFEGPPGNDDASITGATVLAGLRPVANGMFFGEFHEREANQPRFQRSTTDFFIQISVNQSRILIARCSAIHSLKRETKQRQRRASLTIE